MHWHWWYLLIGVVVVILLCFAAFINMVSGWDKGAR